jgi:hypothetical protein
MGRTAWDVEKLPRYPVRTYELGLVFGILPTTREISSTRSVKFFHLELPTKR